MPAGQKFGISTTASPRHAGGPDCLWLGMVNGDPLNSHLSFCDLKSIGERAEILMSDQQGRGPERF